MQEYVSSRLIRPLLFPLQIYEIFQFSVCNIYTKLHHNRMLMCKNC